MLSKGYNMHNIELTTDLSGLRKQLRALDREISFLRHETQSFRQMGFGRDIKDLQLMALEDEREALLRTITKLQGPTRSSRYSNRKTVGRSMEWAFIPVGMALLAFGALKSRVNGESATRLFGRRPNLRTSIASTIRFTGND
jgi:hypothetical protein